MSEMNQKSNVSTEKTEFRREIGVFGGVSILGGIMIGSGIFYLGSVVLMRTGFSLGLAIVCWIVGGLVSMLGGLCYAELGAMMPKAGGNIVYLNQAYHPLVGFLSGFNSWCISGPGSLAAGAVALATMLGFLETRGKVFATVILIVFTAYNYFGVKMGAVLQNITMIAKLIPIFLIMIAALFMGDVSPQLSMTPVEGSASMGDILGMIAFATIASLWAYEGWTNLNTVAEEIKNPKRNLPLSIIIAIGGITLIYTLFNYAIFRVIPFDEIRTMIEAGDLYLGTETAKRVLGSVGGMVVTAGMLISMLGSINGMTLAFPRMYYAMAEEGHFFPSFKKLHPKYKVPTAALLCQCFISILLIWVRSLSQLTSLVVFSGMLFTLLTVIAVLVFRKKMPDAERPYKVWGGKVTVYITILINLALIGNTIMQDGITCLIGFIVPFFGAMVYFYFDKKLKAGKAAA